MSKLQTKWFLSEVETEMYNNGNINTQEVSNNFYVKSRARSNIVFPLGLSGKDGLPKLTANLIENSLSTYSCKFTKLIKRLKKDQLSFVYTNFSAYGGLRTLCKCLRVFGWKDFLKHGAGPKRYAIWSGEQTLREKDTIKKTFNSLENNDSSRLQVVLGSPAIKEGVSFLRIRQIHILEPYWNNSRIEQIYGRGVRFCSHKSLPKSERTVDIYIYVAVVDGSKITNRNILVREINPDESVDGYILQLAEKKKKKTSEIIKLIINNAVDKGLNQ